MLGWVTVFEVRGCEGPSVKENRAGKGAETPNTAMFVACLAI